MPKFCYFSVQTLQVLIVVTDRVRKVIVIAEKIRFREVNPYFGPCCSVYVCWFKVSFEVVVSFILYGLPRNFTFMACIFSTTVIA